MPAVTRRLVPAVLAAGLVGASHSYAGAQTASVTEIDVFLQTASTSYGTQDLTTALDALARAATAVDEAKAGGPPAPARNPGTPVRVGIDVPAPRRVKGETARYSVEAAQAGIVGLVIVDFVIGVDGRVRDAHVVRSIPMLDKRALDAVKKWEYEPVRVGGKPTEATMEVIVNFTFRRQLRITDEIDLARFYVQEQRLDDAARVIAEATSAARDEASWFGGGPSAPDPSKPRLAGGESPDPSIVAPRKIKDVRPIYPDVAIGVRDEGTVIVEGLIDTQGNVIHTRVIKSIPLLDQAAVDAVSQWKFTPLLKNGVATSVMMIMTANFHLH